LQRCIQSKQGIKTQPESNVVEIHVPAKRRGPLQFPWHLSTPSSWWKLLLFQVEPREEQKTKPGEEGHGRRGGGIKFEKRGEKKNLRCPQVAKKGNT